MSEEEILRRRARARAVLNLPLDPTKAPRLCVICNVGCITISDNAPRKPNYEWRWAETRLCSCSGPQAMRGPAIQFERAQDESAGDFMKRVIDSLPAVLPDGSYAIATFSSPNIPQGNFTIKIVDTTQSSQTPSRTQ